MDIRIHPEFIERLSQINWFSRVFEPTDISTDVPHFYVVSWDEAKPLFRDIKWEVTTNEASNVLSSYIGMRYPELFQNKWNELVIESYPVVASLIEPKAKEVMEHYKLGKTFIHCVEWDVGSIIMEDVYRDTDAPTRFYSELLKFYEAGHFPCGWKGGKWPKGVLAVA
ncbi:MAG TPA: hypothetical protein VF627_14345 [Abditibacterium sp.]